MKDFQFVIQNFLKDHQKHKKYLALLIVLSMIVSFAVPFSLIMPAVSMNGELICGMEEHIHSDECYELTCGLEESEEHIHNADCYTLVCDTPEHIHSQECYSYEEENYAEDLSQSASDNLVCGMEEHTHSDECYELTCGLEESEEHMHNADCYTLVCDIPEHIHSQECYSYEEEFYEEENNFNFENLSPDAINISNVKDNDEQGRTLVSNMNSGVDANDGYSKGKLSEVSLLIGDGVEWAANCKNASDVIEAAKRKYFLGIASDFCVFLENDFRPINADAEGRVAVGGDIEFTNNWNYQIGNGDYASAAALKNTDNYIGVTDFAHAIANGKIKNINTLSQGKNGDDSYLYPADEDLYKRFVIGSSTDINNCTHFKWPGPVDTPYQVSCPQHNINEIAQFYQADLIDFTDTFNWLRQQSEKLSKKTATGTYEYKDESLSTDNSNDKGSRYTLILTGPGINSDINTVYFSLPNWDSDVRRIMFKDIPNNANLVVNCGGEKVIIGGTGDNDKMIYTYINGEMISNTGTNDRSTNNNEKSSKILYNFYQAVSDSDYNPNVKLSEDSSQKNKAGVYVNTNFNGTIFAPNADVRSEDGCDGHLSGSLIAKTFTGGLEFGYRPYRGGMEDILGSSMGYTIPVDKIVKGSDKLLAGAKFEITDSDNKVVNSFTTIGTGTNFVDIPSKVDFTGGETYTSGQRFTGEYTIKEVSAPEGYIKTDTPYTVTITEEIQSDGLIETGSGTIPTHIIATVQFGSSTPFNIELKDTYSYYGSSSKQIRRELKIDNETFYLEIDNGKVTAVSKQDNTAETQTGTYVSVLNPNAETDVLVYSTSYSDVLDEKGLTQTATSVNTIYDEPIAKYNIGKIVYNSNTNPDISNVKFILYYSNGDHKEILPKFENGADNWSDTGNYWHEFQIDNVIQQDVVGFKIVRVSTGENNTEVYNDINANDLLNNIVFQDDKWETIEGLRGNWGVTDSDKITAETTTRTEITSWVVTTDVEVSYHSISYCTQFTNNTYYIYPTMQLSESIGNKQTVTTTITLEGGGTKEEKYYYNPDNIMMMPMPSENPTFENRCGLLFQKVDSSTNARLSGATIELQRADNEPIENIDDIWNWTGSSFTIDPEKLTAGVVYKFVETAAPDGYEFANHIYFKKINNTKIRYASSEDDLNSDDNTKYTTLDLTTNRTITMSDIKITGAKVKLKKTADNGTTLLNGAKFNLYSADDETTPIYPISGEGFEVNGEIDLYNTFKNATDGTYNTTYIQNGYLKEGLYYLQEVEAPSNYQTPTDPFYFTIKKNTDGTYDVETGLPQYVSLNLSSENENKKWFTYDENNNKMDDNCSGGITNVQSVLIKASTQPIAWTNLENPRLDFTLVGDGIYEKTFDSPVNLSKFEVQHPEYNPGLTIEYIDFVTSNGNYRATSSGGSSGGGSSITDENSTIIKFNNFNVGNGTNYTFDFGVDYANKKITKIEIDHTQAEHSGAIQFKPNNNQVLQQSVSGTNTTIIDANNISGFNVGSNGTIPVTWWWVNISEIRFYFAKDTTGNNSGSTDPETPSTGGGEGGNTSGNTEEGAIDKDTTVTEAGYVGLIVKNSPLGDKTSIKVTKNWVDDTDYKTLRPENIQVQLYRSTTPNLKPNELTNDMKLGNSVTLPHEGKWEYTWTNLDTKDGSNTYCYYVKEVNVPDKYNDSYDRNGANTGDITIKNTLKTVDITVNKEWVIPEGVTGVTTPSVKVKLQQSSDGASWTDTGKTLTLESPDWTGTFDKLLAGKYYKVVETNIPTGWTVNYSIDGKKFDNSEAITITNTLSVASLNIKKYWENDDTTTDKRPDIKINIYRSTTPPAGSATSDSVQPSELKAPDANGYNNYSRLLQYSLYFYDANMCGDDVGESSDLNWRDDCHTDDAVLGGYHDAGDHVMFGLPQGYTASTLGWSYYENKAIYDGLGQTEHYQKIMKRFCDFFVASTTLDSNNNVTNFLYQKGNGGTDHSYWGSPENQTQEQRGGLLYTTDSASDIAAEYAAALAQYAINFPNDSDKEIYLNCAKALYAYSVRTHKSASVGEYTSTSYKDDQAWAAAWLYLATNEETYKTDCKNLLDTFTAIADTRGYFWGDVELGAMVVYKRFIDPAYNWSAATNYLSSKCNGDSFVFLNDWGSARHNTALQMVALSASKVEGVDYTDWCKKQMNYILGDNTIASNGNTSTCFVVGFAGNSAKYPHHRGASGYANSSEKNNDCYSTTNGHELVGALVGGPTSSGQYVDKLDGENIVYQTNEVTLDYNATLVGAAAALFAEYRTGTLVTNASQIGTKGEVRTVYSQPNPVFTVYGKSAMYKDRTQTLSYVNAKGTVTWSSSDTDILTVDENGLVTAISNGQATITATDSFDNSTASFEITVTSNAITPDIPEDAELVDTITLTSSKSWQEELSDLPITDGQGNTYYYYIAEVDDNNRIIGTTGATPLSGYIPVDYDNGKSLSKTDNTELSVTNKKSDVDDVSMPSTGGTGTQPYKVIGFAVVGGAVIMLGIRRRKKHC